MNTFQNNLIRLSDKTIGAVYNCQLKYPQDKNFGSLYCSAHGYHSSAALAILPLAEYGIRTQNAEYLQGAIDLANWISARQEPDGSFLDPSYHEPDYSAVALLSLAIAYPEMKKHLLDLDQRGLHETITKACAHSIKHVDKKKSRNAMSPLLPVALMIAKENCLCEYGKHTARLIDTHIETLLNNSTFPDNKPDVPEWTPLALSALLYYAALSSDGMFQKRCCDTLKHRFNVPNTADGRIHKNRCPDQCSGSTASGPYPYLTFLITGTAQQGEQGVDVYEQQIARAEQCISAHLHQPGGEDQESPCCIIPGLLCSCDMALALSLRGMHAD